MLFEEDARRDVQMSQSEHSSLWKCSLFHYHDYQINLKKKLRFYTYSLYNLQTLTDPSSNCSARPSLCVRNSAVRFEQIQFVSEQEKVDEQEKGERIWLLGKERGRKGHFFQEFFPFFCSFWWQIAPLSRFCEHRVWSVRDFHTLPFTWRQCSYHYVCILFMKSTKYM